MQIALLQLVGDHHRCLPLLTAAAACLLGSCCDMHDTESCGLLTPAMFQQHLCHGHQPPCFWELVRPFVPLHLTARPLWQLWHALSARTSLHVCAHACCLAFQGLARRIGWHRIHPRCCSKERCVWPCAFPFPVILLENTRNERKRICSDCTVAG